MNINLQKTAASILSVLCVFFFSCEDELIDTTVTKSVSNEQYTLTMGLSDDIVNQSSNIKVDISLERRVDTPFYLPAKALGEWTIRQIDSLELKEDSLIINYKFLADSTFQLTETYTFDIKSLGSQVVGDWSVTQDSDYPEFQIIDTSTTIDTTTWAVGDTNFSSIIQLTEIKDTTKYFDYAFYTNYELTLTSKHVYEIISIIQADTAYAINTTTVIETTHDTTIVKDSTSSDRNGYWEYSPDSLALQIDYFDIPGGDSQLFSLSFDTDQSEIPLGSYMYWNGENHAMELKKTGLNTNFNEPGDSTVSFAGGWVFSQTDDQLMISTTLNGNTESGNIVFDTQSSSVPIGGFMFWQTNNRLIKFEKIANAGYYDPNFGGDDMILTLSALGGTIYELSSSTGSAFKSFTVTIGTQQGDEYNTAAFFKPSYSSSTSPNGYISTQFNDLILSTPIFIIIN